MVNWSRIHYTIWKSREYLMYQESQIDERTKKRLTENGDPKNEDPFSSKKHLSHKLSLLASVVTLCVHALSEFSVKGSERETCQNPTQTQVGSDICSWNISGSFERSLLAAFIEHRLIVSRWRSRSCAEKITENPHCVFVVCSEYPS